MSFLGTPRSRALSLSISGSRGTKGTDALRELRLLVESSTGSVAEIRPRLLELIECLEQSQGGGGGGGSRGGGGGGGSLLTNEASELLQVEPSVPVDPEQQLRLQKEKIDRFLELVPQKRITKPASPFMVNELMPADAVLNAPGRNNATKTARNLKKGTKGYEKKLEEMKKVLNHLNKVVEQDVKLHEDVGNLYSRLLSDGNAETLFFECEGQRQIENMIFTPRISASSLVMTLALYFSIMKLPLFSTDNILFAKGKSSFLYKLLEVFCTRGEITVQRAALFMVAKVAEMIGQKDLLIWHLIEQWHRENPSRLHPLGTVVDIMVTHRDGIVLSSGLKLVNLLIKTCEDGPSKGQLDDVLQSTSYHRAVIQFTKSPTAQAIEEVAVELKKYQAAFLNDLKRRALDKFSLSDPEHRAMLVEYWKLRHGETVPCPVTAESAGYTEETKALWMDIGFFADPVSVLPHVLRMSDLLHFAKTCTQKWSGILDKLSATRKMAEKAKGAMIGKIDFDVAAVSGGLTSRIIELITSPAPLIPAQQILWIDSGRTAIHSAGMDMARLVFISYKLYDRNNSKQLLDDTIVHLLGALQGNPPNEEHLARLMTFFASRSSEEDRSRTLRGAGKLSAATTAPGVPAGRTSGSNAGLAQIKAEAAAMAAAVAAGGGVGAAGGGIGAPPTASSNWRTKFPNLYRTSLDEMEPGPGGVPQLILVLTEAILSCGGESSVGLFRLQPSTEALEAVEERLDMGNRNADVFRNVTDPNIPGIVLKRLFTALDPPLIDKYSAVVEAVRMNQFPLLMDILGKLDPVNKATLNHLIAFLRFLSEPSIAEKTKMDASNVAMVFAPTLLRDESRGDRPSLGASFLEKDCILYLTIVAEKIP